MGRFILLWSEWFAMDGDWFWRIMGIQMSLRTIEVFLVLITNAVQFSLKHLIGE